MTKPSFNITAGRQTGEMKTHAGEKVRWKWEAHLTPNIRRNKERFFYQRKNIEDIKSSSHDMVSNTVEIQGMMGM